MMEGELKQVAAEDLLINQKKDGVSEPTEGFLDNGEAKEPEEPQGELNDADYTSAGEGGDEEENEEDGQESVEQEETTSFVRCFYEGDDEEDGRRTGCAFENPYVHGEGAPNTLSSTRLRARGTQSRELPQSFCRLIQTAMGSRTYSSSRAPVSSR